MSGYVTANGSAAFETHLRLPRVGVWHADLMLPSRAAGDFPEGGRVALTVAGVLKFAGTVRSSGVSRGGAFVRVVGGGGGMPATAPAKAYRNVTLGLPLGEALAIGKERLSPTVSSAYTSKFLTQWVRIRQSVGQEIQSLIGAAGAGLAWRTLPDGSVWFGSETWPATALTKWTLLQDEPTRKSAIISADLPAVLPGETIEGRRIGYIDHHFTDSALRSELWFENG